MTNLAERLTGAVWGHLVGDAMGVPYEFQDASAIGEVRWGEQGTYGQSPGTWSDDGALMLALLDSLLETGFDTDDQGRRALAWYREGRYTPDGDGHFDIGNATREALLGIERGTPAEHAGPAHEQAGGNGSLMRILPVALVGHAAPAEVLVEQAHRASKVTHGHARPQVACALYVLVARRLLTGAGGRAKALAGARKELRALYESHPLGGEFLSALEHLEGWTERQGRGRVWDSSWSAWEAFAGAHSYQETVERAIGYGNDTDTTAAIAGGLAGIRWGIGGIPVEWLDGMRGKDIVAPFIARLLEHGGYKTDQLRVDWVELATAPGLAQAPGALGMTFLPGKRGAGRAGLHWRNLEADAATLRGVHQANTLLVLVEDHELESAGVRRLDAVMHSHDVELLRHPIVDGGVPPDAASYGVLLDGLRSRIEAGQRVVVACMGGLGRTGTAVSALLVDAGMDAESAIDLTRRTRPGAIENWEQEEFVRRWQDQRRRSP
ncbi:MAG TPA: ADP-ribosylglycohydrolase family protein [Candidatus Limnocylindria bacterium]|nr:ADP-ribosylglycohydrolase family protein [Candidatus Limnocylindria bacterium]